MKYKVNLQIASTSKNFPNRFQIQRWVTKALEYRLDTAELCIRIVDENESQALNSRYRNKHYPTNVLSFPSELPEEIQLENPLLGDLIICAPIIEKEAEQQQKTLEAHWAHMIIHGILHLLGYDHIEDKEAEVMETIEITLLQTLGFANPYAE